MIEIGKNLSELLTTIIALGFIAFCIWLGGR